MSFSKKIDNVSNGLFFIGFLVGKLKYVPLGPIVVSSIVSASLYLIAYLLNILVFQFSSDNYSKARKWYGFLKYKEQFTFSAILGILAMSLSVVAAFFPIALMPALWIFTISNCVWCVGIYNKIKYPPQSNEHSDSKERTYLKYAVLMTLVSCIGALAATAMFFFPPVAPIIFLVSGVIGAALTVAATREWILCYFQYYPPTNETYNILRKGLGGRMPEVGQSTAHTSPIVPSQEYSPTRRLFTPAPTSTTTPASSWPKTAGKMPLLDQCRIT